MRPKLPKKGILEKIPTGLHRVVVKKIDYLRSVNNRVIMDAVHGNVPRALSVLLQDSLGRQTEDIFWFTEKSQWKMDAFARAIKCNLTNGENATPADEIVNKRWLYIIIAAQQYVDNDGAVVMATKEKALTDYVMLPTYYCDSVLVPTIDGDPNIPSGKFILPFKHISQKSPYV